MITRTYISKFNTIIKDSNLNTGINPVAELVYGANTTRMLVYFDHNHIKNLVEDKVFPDTSKLKHTLKITNAGSLDFTQMHCGETSSIADNVKIRTSSFDLIFFLLPMEWDGGKGFDYAHSFFNQGYYARNCGAVNVDSKKLLSSDGSNWFQARNGFKWSEEGVYSNETLSNEYDKWSSDEGSKIIIGRQHFDIGNEDIEFDITDVMNLYINGYLENYGIGIAFSPRLERTKDEVDNYVGFMTHKTPSFFEPYVETTYNDYIDDDRTNFALNKDNKLYLYCNVGGSLTNLDEMPTCSVDGTEYEVKQETKGVYYIDIKLSSKQYKPNTMLYDTWGNIKLCGEQLEDVELDFVTKSQNIFFGIGDKIEENQHFTPTVYGIQSDEKIKRGDVRKLTFLNKINYDRNKASLVSDMEWRLYIKDGTREVEVFKFEKVNKAYDENFVMVDTNVLIPQRYYVDVRYKYNFEVIEHHDILSFDIVDDLNNKFN